MKAGLSKKIPLRRSPTGGGIMRFEGQEAPAREAVGRSDIRNLGLSLALKAANIRIGK